VRRALLVVALVVGVAGCGVGPDKDGPTRAARAFYAALARGDGPGACAQLAPQPRHKLEESEGESCAEAATSLDLSGTTVRSVDVFGHGARVVLDGDTAFLGRFPDGWRITAAGCKESGKELPYDCQVEG
jgi:hypothetical protein